MKRFTVVVLTLVLVFSFAGAVSAADDVDMSGELKSDLVVNSEEETWYDTETFNLMLEKKFGFDADMYLDLEFKSTTQDVFAAPESEESNNLVLHSATTHQRKTNVNIDEAYVNYYTENMDWRLGKQEINWGSAYKLNPTSYFNPRDLTVLKPMDEKKAVKAAKGVYYAPANIEVSSVVTPFFTTHKAGQERKLEMMNQFKTKVAENIAEKDKLSELNDSIKKLNAGIKETNKSPGYEFSTLDKLNFSQENVESNWLTGEVGVNTVEDNIDNTQGGIKVTKRSLMGFDVSASFYHGRDKLPVINKQFIEDQTSSELDKDVKDALAKIEKGLTEIENTGTTDIEMETQIEKINNADNNIEIPTEALYPDTNRVGVDVIGDIGDMGVWTEVAYSMYPEDTDWSTEDNPGRIEAAAGVDYKFENDLYLVGQTYYQEGRLDSEPDIKAVNLHFEQPVFDFHEIKMNAIYEVESETYMVEPQFDYSLADATVLQLGGTYLESEEENSSDLISSLGNDRVYARLKVEF